MTSVVLYANVEALLVRPKTLFGWEPNLQIANTPKDTILLAMKYVITYLRFFLFFCFCFCASEALAFDFAENFEDYEGPDPLEQHTVGTYVKV